MAAGPVDRVVLEDRAAQVDRVEVEVEVDEVEQVVAPVAVVLAVPTSLQLDKLIFRKPRGNPGLFLVCCTDFSRRRQGPRPKREHRVLR